MPRTTLAAVCIGFALGVSAPLSAFLYNATTDRRTHVDNAITSVCALDDALVRVLNRAASNIPKDDNSPKANRARHQVQIDIRDIRSTAVCPVPKPPPQG